MLLPRIGRSGGAGEADGDARQRVVAGAGLERGVARPEHLLLGGQPFRHQELPHPLQRIVSDAWAHGYGREKAAFPVEWVRRSKFWPSVGRVESAYGDRNLVCSCLPTDAYAEVVAD